MMRLMFITGSLCYGGAERHAVTLMNRLGERGFECHAVHVKSGADLADRIRVQDGSSVRSLDAGSYFDRGALERLARHIASIEPAAIVAANSYALMYASLAVRLARRRAPVVVTFHSTRLLNWKEHVQMLAYRPLFWAADCAIFVCERQKRYWLRRGVLSRRNEVIYNGVNMLEFNAGGGGAAARAALGLRDSDYVIGLPAVLRREKNHVQLVEAIAALRAQGIPARALMIGDGPMRAAVEARARERGVEQHVVISGFQHDVRPYVAACDVVTLCSFTEAFSLAAVEAMAMGKAVVHSDVGGAAEMIDPGCNGYLFPVGDTAALVASLAVLSDKSTSRAMGTHARTKAQALFSEQTMVERYEKTLLGVCATRLRAQAGIAG
jgi:glycosyltransferase involved in cell wall biosynthesis